MDERLLEIRDHKGWGYEPLVDFGGWRVAMLRPEDQQKSGQHPSMERHLETDEVFVLTRGEGMIILGGNGPQPGKFEAQPMELGKIYNVRQRAWHRISLSPDAAVVIVENRDTVRENSEYADLNEDQTQEIRASAKWNSPDAE
jgi:hypothetical protein